ncbi:hypothetical protein [Blastococcus saxobsidens]|nr:hypothetical protein [Blastococcus saxobsidens]
MADLYDQTYLAEARLVGAVAAEISRRAVRRTAPGDPRRQGPADRAARVAAGRYRPLLDAAAPRPTPAPPHLTSIEASLHTRAQRKQPGKILHPDEHRGESESIHAAAADGSGFVSCDDDARLEAAAHGVPVETFVDIARRLAAIQRDVKPKRIVSELQSLARNGIDIGDVVQSVLDLRIAP